MRLAQLVMDPSRLHVRVRFARGRFFATVTSRASGREVVAIHESVETALAHAVALAQEAPDGCAET